MSKDDGLVSSKAITYADIGPWQRYVDFVHDLAAEEPTTETDGIIAAAGDILMDLPNRATGSAIPERRCDGCRKVHAEVKKLIQLDGCMICDGCIGLLHDIVTEPSADNKGDEEERRIEERLVVTDLCDVLAFEKIEHVRRRIRRAINFIEGYDCFPGQPTRAGDCAPAVHSERIESENYTAGPKAPSAPVLTETERAYSDLVAKEHDRVSRQGFNSGDPPRIDVVAAPERTRCGTCDGWLRPDGWWHRQGCPKASAATCPHGSFGRHSGAFAGEGCEGCDKEHERMLDKHVGPVLPGGEVRASSEGSLAGQFRKRPVVVQATQFYENVKPWPEGVEAGPEKLGGGTIQTLEGRMTVSDGDWIITGVKGERYPCKPDIFDLTYEHVSWGAAEQRSGEDPQELVDRLVRENTPEPGAKRVLQRRESASNKTSTGGESHMPVETRPASADRDGRGERPVEAAAVGATAKVATPHNEAPGASVAETPHFSAPNASPDHPPFPWRAVTVTGRADLVNVVSDAHDGPCDHTVVASMVPKNGWFHRWLMGAEDRSGLSSCKAEKKP